MLLLFLLLTLALPLILSILSPPEFLLPKLLSMASFVIFCIAVGIVLVLGLEVFQWLVIEPFRRHNYVSDRFAALSLSLPTLLPVLAMFAHPMPVTVPRTNRKDNCNTAHHQPLFRNA